MRPPGGPSPPATGSGAPGTVGRRAFAPAELDALVAFATAHGAAFDAALVRRLVLEMTSSPECVLVIADAGGPLLAAVVLDRLQNSTGAANLEVLAVRARVPADVFARQVLEPAIALARAAGRSLLLVALQRRWAERVEDVEAVLGAAGLAPAFETFIMRRGPDAPAPEPSPALPAGWRWAPLDEAGAAAAHAALGEMFRGALSFGLSPLPTFTRAVASGASLWRVLLHDPGGGGGGGGGEQVAGLVQVVAQGEGGELRTVGRVPAYRGQGLGPRLVAEGLRLLHAHGAREIALEVDAANEGALALYRRFGFVVASRTPNFALRLQ
jgi:ribosomal protein S18 acetylase RimI-like enzyme